MELFTTAELAELCYRGRELLWTEPLCLQLKAPICVFGDIHGQFDDLLSMFDLNGWPLTKEEYGQLKEKANKTNAARSKLSIVKSPFEEVPKSDFCMKKFKDAPARYLFLGDYVDRGPYSIEVVTLLIALKLNYPNRIFMLRGNHESRPVNKHYGFYREVKYRYCKELYECYQDMFNMLPVTAVVNDTIMCMHGGISSHLTAFEQFDVFQRPLEIPDVGIIADLTWADPDPSVEEYQASPRGASFVFGSVALRAFLKKLGLQLIVRAHQVVEDGYEFFDERRLVTIFSAPNYCGQQDNTASILIIDESLELSFHLYRPEARELERLKPPEQQGKKEE
ncbi:unnamed protein product [Caenorhabditis bovis]|uniref:Serine/threonine-protein phosphatase n=1 Tax=Caenorhabditis bovis TaxID=2654633 RepID=A0A8S1ER44_9PELO|nr:unnamed protein product [Caenorhabditis bovis]